MTRQRATRGDSRRPARQHHPYLALAAAIAIAFSALAPAGVAAASTKAPVTTDHTIKVGDLTRRWIEIAPGSGVSASLPIVVMLSGNSAGMSLEIARDGFVPYVQSGDYEAVYAVPIKESWDAGGCCGKAAAEGVNDVGFLQALVPALDPGYKRQIDLVGYSNGGRLLYRIACSDPSLFDAYAVVKAMPEPGCVVTKPVDILQIDSTDDTYVPYKPGDKGEESPPATTEVARLRASDGCTSASSTVQAGLLSVQTWSDCADHARVSFATYTGGVHTWPAGTASTPSAATVIWSFFSRTALT